MAKYTSQSISGYNTSPPPDDGTQVASNEVEWQKHLDKIGDPNKTFSEDINTAVVALAATTFFNNVQAKSANFTVGASDQGDLFICNGTADITATLTSAATLGKGFACSFYNEDPAFDVNLSPDGSENVNGVTPFVVGPKEGVVIVSNGVNWFSPARFFTETSIGNATETTAGIVEKATIVEARAETADKYIDASLVQYNPGAAKAWVQFSPAGTILDDHNVTSVSKVATGKWTVTIANDMSNNDYSAQVTGETRDDSAIDMASIRSTTLAVGSIGVRGMNVGLSAADLDSLHVTIHGDR